jgi:hypothetical protein
VLSIALALRRKPVGFAYGFFKIEKHLCQTGQLHAPCNGFLNTLLPAGLAL